MKIPKFKEEVITLLKEKIVSATSLYGMKGKAIAPLLTRAVDNLEEMYGEKIKKVEDFMRLCATDKEGNIDINLLGEVLDSTLADDIPFTFMGCDCTLNKNALKITLPDNVIVSAIVGKKNTLVFTPDDIEELVTKLKTM